MKGKGHARDRKQRTQCIFIRIWQVNTRWQQCCHAGRGAFRGVNVQCGRQTTGPCGEVIHIADGTRT